MQDVSSARLKGLRMKASVASDLCGMGVDQRSSLDAAGVDQSSSSDASDSKAKMLWVINLV